MKSLVYARLLVQSLLQVDLVHGRRNCLVSFSVPTLLPPITRQLEIDSLAVDDVSTNSTDGFVLGKKACCDSCAHAGPCNATLSNDSDVKLK